MSTELRHEPENSRYTFWDDDVEVGLTDYMLHDGAIDIVHTEIDPSRRHSGLGAEMVEAVLSDIRQRDAGRVIPTCPFVSRFILRNSEYRELMAN